MPGNVSPPPSPRKPWELVLATRHLVLSRESSSRSASAPTTQGLGEIVDTAITGS